MTLLDGVSYTLPASDITLTVVRQRRTPAFGPLLLRLGQPPLDGLHAVPAGRVRGEELRRGAASLLREGGVRVGGGLWKEG